jgi:hypothetical protein
MTTNTQQISTAPTTAPSWPALAAIGMGAAAVLTAVGTFWDLTGNEDGSATMSDFYLWLTFNLGVIVVAAAIVFGLVVRTATAANAGRRALTLAVIGLVTVPVAWTGLPAVLATGAIGCVMADRHSGRPSRLSQSAVAIAVLAFAGAVVFAIAG